MGGGVVRGGLVVLGGDVVRGGVVVLGGDVVRGGVVVLGGDVVKCLGIRAAPAALGSAASVITAGAAKPAAAIL